jgi:uncharacterized membrane protein
MINTFYALIGLFVGGNLLQVSFKLDYKIDEERNEYIRERLHHFHALVTVLFWTTTLANSIFYYFNPLPYYLTFVGTPLSHFAYHVTIVCFSIYIGASFNYYVRKIFFKD